MFPSMRCIRQLFVLLERGSHKPFCLYVNAIDIFGVVGYSAVLHIVLDQALKIAQRYDRAVRDSSTYRMRMSFGLSPESIAACQHRQAYVFRWNEGQPPYKKRIGRGEVLLSESFAVTIHPLFTVLFPFLCLPMLFRAM
jgi:hypothetical protein